MISAIEDLFWLSLQEFSAIAWCTHICQGPLNGGVSNGGVSRSGLVLPFLSFFCPFLSFFVLLGLSRGFSRFARGWSGDFPDSSLFLFLGLLRAPTRNSPERVRDTIWTFPEKSGKHPGLETPRFSFSKYLVIRLAVADILLLGPLPDLPLIGVSFCLL